MGFLALGFGIRCTFVSTIYDAKTLADYTQSFCICSFVALNLFILINIIVKVGKMFELINGFDQLVNTSKLGEKTNLFPKYRLKVFLSKLKLKN